MTTLKSFQYSLLNLLYALFPEMNTVAPEPATLSAKLPSARPAGSAPPSRWRSLVVTDQMLIAVLILLALALYGNSLFNAFVYDDEQQILQNPYVKSWHYLPQIFGSTVWSFVGAAGTTNYYRPLMTFTFLLLYQLFGDVPFGFHLFNITLNAAVVVMVFYAGRRLFQDRRIAFVAAFLFAMHPVHTEVADWIAAVPELEVTFFALLTFWLFTRLDDRASWKLYLATVLSFILTLLSKEPGLMFAPLAIAYEHFVRPGHERSSLLAKIKRYAPLCVVAAAYLLLRITLFGKLAPVRQHSSVTWPQAIYSGFALIAGYAKYLVWPAPLSAFHVFQPSTSPAQLPVVTGILIVLSAIALISYLYKRAPAAAFCILWMGITIGPMLNARWMASNVFTERYLYLPSVGFCWLVAWCGMKLWDSAPAFPSWRRGVLLSVGVVLVPVAAIAITRRNQVWRDDLTLYTCTLQTNPDASIIRSNLAGRYLDDQQYQRARQEWELALAQKPDNVVTMNALGIVYTRLGLNEQAAQMFKRAIAAKPLWGDSHFNYGLLLQKTGDRHAALQEFKTAVEVSPLSAPAHRWYGEALVENSRLEEGIEELNKSVALDASFPTMHELVTALLRAGNTQQAQLELQRIISRFPYDSESHFQLARLFENAGRKAEARREYQAGLSTDTTNVEALAALKRLEN